MRWEGERTNVNIARGDIDVLAKSFGIGVEEGCSTMSTGVGLRILVCGRGSRHENEIPQRSYAAVPLVSHLLVELLYH
jgi:hypothetical protein